jgi:hypothetical protein
MTTAREVASDVLYRRLLEEASSLLRQDAETRLRLADVLRQLVDLSSEDEVAADVGLSPGVLRRLLRVHRFWCDVRIAPTGRRVATYHLYDRVALDQLLGEDDRLALRALAPDGVEVVTAALRAARDRVLSQLDGLARDPALARRLTVRRATTTVDAALGALDAVELLTTDERDELLVALSRVFQRVVALPTSTGDRR